MYWVLTVFFIIMIWATMHYDKPIYNNEKTIFIISCLAMVIGMILTLSPQYQAISNTTYDAGLLFAIIGWLVHRHNKKHRTNQ